MTPDARVQEAVELMRRLGTDGEQPVTNQLIEAGLAYHERTFVYGYLASTPETERLRSALAEISSFSENYSSKPDSVLSTIARIARRALTPPRDPQ